MENDEVIINRWVTPLHGEPFFIRNLSVRQCCKCHEVYLIRTGPEMGARFCPYCGVAFTGNLRHPDGVIRDPLGRPVGEEKT